MNRELIDVIGQLRAALATRREWTMMNLLPAPAAAGGPDAARLPAAVREFLAVTDGATCGDVTLFSAANVPAMQFYADPVPGAAAAVLSREEWLCCGVVGDEPLFVHRATGEIWYFPDTGTEWPKSSAFEKAADDLHSFFLHHMAGPGYPALSATGRDDQWADLLDSLGRLA
ncbi:hypothetical protein [Streptomyces peucetius]|uniref:SMI1/KNR4 family protein n=1 Tax=Streptomyces peucetius TaxID=1950 RepID=A0ABY6IBL6_STRPE|nr:hypothetical protein [Streptomyces peucetius]UYQ64385.1 hypothetical protein OGH68_24895 [Streptomyces peucetius]